MSPNAVSNFVKLQGLGHVAADSCAAHYNALNFQPLITAALVVPAIVLQSAPLFLALAVIQWFNVIAPRWNMFDAIYNASLAKRPGAERLTPAPAPRRFSMGMSASFFLGIGVSLLQGWTTVSIVLQVFVGVALSAIILGKFCLGSYIYHLVRGQAGFANRTLPWSRA